MASTAPGWWSGTVIWGYVPSEQPTISYRSPDGLHVSSILCFKHRRKVARDNTVKFDWHTLQLLPSTDRPSYAGFFVEVQERLDGELVVRHENSTIPTQEAPPRPGALRALNGAGGRNANELGRSLPRYNVKDRKVKTRTNGGSKASPSRADSPLHARGLDGRLSKELSGEDYLCVASPGSWASTRTQSASTLQPRALRCTAVMPRPREWRRSSVEDY